MSKHRHVRKVLIKSFPHSYPGRDLPSLQFCPSTSLRGLRRETVKKHVMNHFQSISSICISLHVVAFVHAPSLTRSNTSLASKLISSVSWPTYWYNARQRGPWGRGCGLGAGGGRWWMLIFLCFLWQRGKKEVLMTIIYSHLIDLLTWIKLTFNCHAWVENGKSAKSCSSSAGHWGLALKASQSQ